jgi:hypothetical protein
LRWWGEPDGIVYRLGGGGPPAIPDAEHIALLDGVQASWRRLDAIKRPARISTKVRIAWRPESQEVGARSRSRRCGPVAALPSLHEPCSRHGSGRMRKVRAKLHARAARSEFRNPSSFAPTYLEVPRDERTEKTQPVRKGREAVAI